MITFLIPLATRIVGPKLARPVIYAVFAVLLISLLGIGKCTYDRHIIAQHDTRQALKQSEADRKADQVVAKQRRSDDVRIIQEVEELERITENATDDMARQLARHHCIRMQQQARRDGRQSPAC